MKNNNNIIIIVGIFVFILFIVILSSNTNTNQNNINTNVYDETMKQQFVDIGFTSEQAQISVNIMKKIGINSISSIENYNTNGYYDESYPKKEDVDNIYECKGNDNTQYECNFLMFVKYNEIIHISYYGYGTKTKYYTKEKGILHKTVHPYVDN